jgi:TPR repeat protein
MNAKPQLMIHFAITAMFLATSAAAVAGDDFPGGEPDRRVLEAQQKVDDLFEKGDYERAYFIYREELAPLGDKYAQYMLGYMNIVGKGVARDYIAGSAWYRLAAERGDASFSQARDEVWEQFDEELRNQSDIKYAELRLYYSDAMIIAAYVEKDLELISRRSQSSTLSNDLVDSQDQFDADPARVVEEARLRIQSRLDFLSDTIESGKPMAAAEIARIQDVEKRALAAIR